MTSSSVTTPTPGNQVVPLSAIIDQLKGKISAADLAALLLAVTSKQEKEVRPGDLITADLMNSVINDIRELDRRLLLLEAGKPAAAKAVAIAEPTPTTVLRIGDPLIIKGEGLLADSLIMIANTPLAGAFGSPGDTTLTIRAIPPLDIPGGLPNAGKLVTLSVSNDLGGASTDLILKPYVLTTPIGSLVIAQSAGPPANTKFAKSGSYPFKFKVAADTKPDIRFDVRPVIVGQPNWTAQAAQTTLFVPAVQSTGVSTVAEVTVTVTIADTASSGDIGTLFVELIAQSDRSFSWRSQPGVKIEVDATSAQVRKLNLALTYDTAGQAEVKKNPDNSLTAWIGKTDGSGGTGEIDFAVTRIDGVALAAGDYQLDMTKLASLPAGWAASIPGAQNGRVNLSGSAQPLTVSLTAQNSAGAATLQVGLQSVSEPGISGYGEFSIDRRHP